jgi:hypothetical protein
LTPWSILSVGSGRWILRRAAAPWSKSGLSLIEGQAIRCDTFGSVNELHTKIRLHQRLERPLPPLHLDQTARQILNNANRKKSSNAGH